jgi:NitT/TauT family transport system substrate-binding protein
MPTTQTRRRFLAALASAGAAGLAHVPPAFGEEGVLETTAVRFQKPGLCGAPQYVAAELLRAEGFTDIRYVDAPPGATEPMARGEVDFTLNYALNFVADLDKRKAVTIWPA